MGFFIYKQYLYYMKLKITESQYNLLVEQNLGKIFSKILKSGDELAQSMSKAIRNINPDVAKCLK